VKEKIPAALKDS